jgi:AcrR family transcriptional regulator
MPETLTRTQKRQKETKERIFRAAVKLFIKKGFENTTVSEITEAADIGKGTFFTYFPTKEAVFGQVGELMMELMTVASDEGINNKQPIAVILKNIITAPAEWHEENKRITQQMIRSNYSTEVDTPNKRRLFDLLMKLIRIGQESGELSADVNAQDAVIVLAGTYFTVLAFWAVTENSSLQERLSSAVDIILKGLLA